MKRAGKAFFTENLLIWNSEINTRTMPWKGEKNPYRIWLSEIILQQTRVEQGRPYYERFVAAYPTVSELAAAPDEEVFRLWQGLGYYARCKNMLAAARTIASTYNGHFPNTYDAIIALKGIGGYTAAAIASFAFNLPHAVLDGNVYRVLARYFGIQTPTDSTDGKKQFTALADGLLDKKQASAYNQAIMDFGAVVCKPQLPDCTACPLSPQCVAYNSDRIGELPVKTKKLVIKQRFFYYIILIYNKQVFIRKRESKDIWQNLHEFILVEMPGPATQVELLASEAFREILPGVSEMVMGNASNMMQDKAGSGLAIQPEGKPAVKALRNKGQQPQPFTKGGNAGDRQPMSVKGKNGDLRAQQMAAESENIELQAQPLIQSHKAGGQRSKAAENENGELQPQPLAAESSDQHQQGWQTSDGSPKASSGVTFEIQGLSAPFKQQLTHQTIFAQFLTIRASGKAPVVPGYQLVPRSLLNDYAFPKTIVSYLERESQGLTLF